ncbi:MAG: DNA internalization-related competence protein ComEC/Rec2 [Quinella sp. 3Q1]|nr:DNA internalization-related competence protein ComEC/Rec2 [Quinella sp. 3Q1]
MKIKVSNSMLNVWLAALAAGVLFMEYFPRTPKFLIGTCAALIIIGLIATWRRKNLTAWIICPIIFFALGGLRFSAVDTVPPNDVSKFAGQSVQISGVVRQEPQIKIMPNGLTQMRFVVDVQGKMSGGLILTYYPKDGDELPAARIGDKISARGNLKLLTNYNNPGQIDGVTRMKADSITARMSAGKQGIEVEAVDGGLWIKFLRLVAAIRQHYRESMADVMSQEDAAAIFAMLFGGYAGLNPELVEDFQTTGIVHILSVSGSHMSMLAMATAWLCLLLKFPRGLTFAVGLFIIGTYAILSGILPQVLRSATMGILIFFAKTLDSEAEGARLLTLTALAMLINQPLLLFDVSFQLSFTATAGLMYLSEDLRNAMERLPKFFAEPASMTIAAQVASLPVIVWYFNQISLSSVLANVFVMPLLEVVIVGGLLGGIIAAVIPIAGRIFFAGEALIFGAGAELNRVFANLPLSAVQVPTLGLWAGFFYYIALIFRRPTILLMIIILLAINLFKAGDVEVSFVDVGQGDCAVVITPHGKCLIFDTGGVREHMFDVGGRVVVPYLKHENIRAVDKIFLTHVHEDHAGGAGAVIKKLPVSEIITAGEPKSEYAAVFGIAEGYLPPLRAGHAREIFSVDGVQVEILFAPNVGTGNEISNVYRVRYGDVTFLITGDLVKEIEAEILRAGVDVSATVLKVGHHGSATSSSEEFLRAVKPKCSVICVGYGNNFGHPRAEVLERLKNLPTKIYRTDRDGLIKFKTDGKTLRVETFVKN